MDSNLVRLWDQSFEQSINCLVRDWSDGVFTVPPYSGFSEELRRWDVRWPRFVTCRSTDEVVWVVHGWDWTRDRMRVVCKPYREVVETHTLKDARFKWRVFREADIGAPPKWVVWEPPSYCERVFDTGEQALNYVARQISERHWASIITEKTRELRELA